MAQHGETQQAKAGQRVALILAGTGVMWILAIWAGSHFGWSIRTQAFFDLAALAGFGFALWQTFQLRRTRRNDKGEN
mgnify:CR=1 FL=1